MCRRNKGDGVFLAIYSIFFSFLGFQGIKGGRDYRDRRTDVTERKTVKLLISR